MNNVIPDPLISLEQLNRYCHSDITELEDTELTDEMNALRPLLWGLDSDSWLRDRVKRLETELAKRRSGDTVVFQFPSKQAEGVEI
jgi:hypothetical protein